MPIHPEKKKSPSASSVKKKGYMKNDCNKYKGWLDKKGNPISLVSYKANMVGVCHNTWWIDSNSTINVSNIL